MGNNTSEPEIITGEPEICMPTTYYEALMKNSITLEKVIRANKIINDATEDLGDNVPTHLPRHIRDDLDNNGLFHHDSIKQRDFRHPDNNNGLSNDDFINENYQYPQVIPDDLMLKRTGYPLTSEVTKSFQMARQIRSPYDKYWLNIYNNHAKKTNYNL